MGPGRKGEFPKLPFSTSMFVGQRVSSSSVRCSFQNSITDVPQLSESQLFSLSPLQRRWLRYVSYAMCQAPNVEPFQSARTALSRPFWSARFVGRSPLDPPRRLRAILQLKDLILFYLEHRNVEKDRNILHHLPSIYLTCVCCCHLRLTKHRNLLKETGTQNGSEADPKPHSKNSKRIRQTSAQGEYQSKTGQQNKVAYRIPVKKTSRTSETLNFGTNERTNKVPIHLLP